MNGIPQLTTGVCDQMASSTGPEDPVWSTSPILQILQARAIGTGDQIRWRVTVSDGVHALLAMAVRQLNPLFDKGEVRKGSIIRVQRIAANAIQNRR